MNMSPVAKAVISQGVHSGMSTTAIIVEAAQQGYALSTKDVDSVRNHTGVNGSAMIITNKSGETTLATPADFIVQPDNRGQGVRVTHVPTGVSVHCDDSRSQLMNKHQAMTNIIPTLENACSFRRWNLVTTEPPLGVRLLLGPRYAPVIGMARRGHVAGEGEQVLFDVVHYNGETLVSDYKTTEWSHL